MMSVPWCIDIALSFVHSIRFVHVDLEFRKPCCSGDIRLFACRQFKMSLLIIRSIAIPGSEVVPFLYMELHEQISNHGLFMHIEGKIEASRDRQHNF